MRRQLLTGLTMTIALIVLLGLAYTMPVYAFGQVPFNDRTTGS